MGEAEISADWLVDVRDCSLEILRCYFHQDLDERAKWWSEDYGGEPSAEAALVLIREQLTYTPREVAGLSIPLDGEIETFDVPDEPPVSAA